jgi:hypothetical protein
MQVSPPALPAETILRHDAEHVRVLRLMVTDTYQWKHAWAEWRLKFHADPSVPGIAARDIEDVLRGRALGLCRDQAVVDSNVLYLRSEADLVAVFDVFGGLTHGPGHIAAVQRRQAYHEAARIAAALSVRHRVAGPEVDPLSLPDMQWHVTGQDQQRVARTRVQGHEVVVRSGYLGGHEMWVVEIDGRANCAHFRARADAMSKLGVGVALETFRGPGRR